MTNFGGIITEPSEKINYFRGQGMKEQRLAICDAQTASLIELFYINPMPQITPRAVRVTRVSMVTP